MPDLGPHAVFIIWAYIGVALVTAVMIRDGAWGWLKSSLAINTAIAAAIAVEGDGWQLRCWQWSG